jgi:hypothetical protein
MPRVFDTGDKLTINDKRLFLAKPNNPVQVGSN